MKIENNLKIFYAEFGEPKLYNNSGFIPRGLIKSIYIIAKDVIEATKKAEDYLKSMLHDDTPPVLDSEGNLTDSAKNGDSESPISLVNIRFVSNEFIS